MKLKLTDKRRVSFDLDEVLFVNPDTHKTEDELRFPLNRIYKERLRKGTIHLIRRLQSEGYEVWVYTSSFRSVSYIRSLFRNYGIKFDGIINGERHLEEVQGNKGYTLPQKVPSKYRITLHVDDEDVICAAGKIYGFNVYQLNDQDDEWEDKIMNRLYEIEKVEMFQESLRQ